MEAEKRWRCVYPVYFDGRRSLADGRRVPRTAACPEGAPTAGQLRAACEALGVACVLEANKRHPSTPDVPGRVRIDPSVMSARFASVHALHLALGGHMRAAVASKPQGPAAQPAPGLAVRRKAKGKGK